MGTPGLGVSEREANMLYFVTAKAKPGLSHSELKASLNLWEHWTPPEGLELKSFHMAVDGSMFILGETESSEALMESIAPWSGIYLNYEVHPVLPIKDAVVTIKKGIAAREKHF